MEDIQIFFSDNTIIETDGDRKKVNKLMDPHEKHVTEWMIESNVGLARGHVESLGVIQFWDNGEAILVDFQSGFVDEMVTIDAIFLNDYLSERGWSFLIDESVLGDNPQYWEKYFSITYEDDIDNHKTVEEDDGEEDFVEHVSKLKEYKKPTANKYNILSLPDFKDHDYDLEKRNKKEAENKF